MNNENELARLKARCAEAGLELREEPEGVSICGTGLVPQDNPAVLSICGTGLELREAPEGLTLCGNGLELRGDFTRMLPRLRQGNLQREFLVKASRIKGLGDHPFAVDATAGLGEDSILLAAAGYYVRMYEHNPVIAALLRDALRRAAEIPELKDYAARMELVEGDSTEALAEMGQAAKARETTGAAQQAENVAEVPESEIPAAAAKKSGEKAEPFSAAARTEDFPAVPDLILLDPMFPARQKSALIGKKLQLLQKLEMPCASEEALLAAALGTGARRVIVKRPLKGPYLAGKKPDYAITGKAIRYDCFVIARKSDETL